MATNPGILSWEIPRTEESVAAAAKSFQLCPTLCDPIDGSPPGSLLLLLLSRFSHESEK